MILARNYKNTLLQLRTKALVAIGKIELPYKKFLRKIEILGKIWYSNGNEQEDEWVRKIRKGKNSHFTNFVCYAEQYC